MKKALKIVGSVLFWVILGAILSSLIIIGVDKATGYKVPFFGLRSTVVITDSMATVHEDNLEELEGIDERIQVNDIVMTKMVKFEELKEHDVVTYLYGKGLVCHRIVKTEIDEEGNKLLFTRGDANNTLDPIVNYEDFRGVVYNVVPKVGGVVLFLQSPYGLLGVSISIVLIVSGIFIGDFVKKKKDKSGDDGNTPSEPELKKE